MMNVLITIDFPSEGELRLYGGSSSPDSLIGQVEVYLGEEWGTVADDDSWSIEDGEVVCRQLGFEMPGEHKYCPF